MSDLLENYQFFRRGVVWNRVFDDVIDVVDIQFGKSQETFTVNVGVAEKFVLQTCWGLDESKVIDEPSCTVRARLGVLLSDLDRWWPCSDAQSINEVIVGITEIAIPFLESNHRLEKMLSFLENKASNRRFPPEAVYIALIYYKIGKRERCRDILNSLREEFNGPWNEKIFQIQNSLD